MKTCLALLVVLVAVVAAQRDHFDTLIQKEVTSLINAHPAMTVDQCTTKCDALFDLVDAADEKYTDDVCKRACDCQIDQNCHHHGHHP